MQPPHASFSVSQPGVAKESDRRATALAAINAEKASVKAKAKAAAAASKANGTSPATADDADGTDGTTDNDSERHDQWRGVLIQLLWMERRWWLIGTLLAGTMHGLVQSVGRFMTLRAAISAVVNEEPFERRVWLGFTVFLVVGLEVR